MIWQNNTWIGLMSSFNSTSTYLSSGYTIRRKYLLFNITDLNQSIAHAGKVSLKVHLFAERELKLPRLICPLPLAGLNQQ